MDSPKTILKVIVWSLLLFVATLWFSKSYFFDQGYLQATKDVRARLEKSGVIAPLPVEVSTVFGIIRSVDEEKGVINLDAYPPYDPASPLSSQTKVVSVVVTDGTEILKRTMNEEDVLKGKTDSLTFNDEKISLSSLKVGDQVNVESKENVLGKSSFVASKIILPE